MNAQEVFSKIGSFFASLFKNKYIVCGLTVLSIFLCLFWYLDKMEHAYYTRDDILDYIIEPYHFWHGRIISETIIVAIIREIPNLLGININEFVVFSKGIFPACTLLITSLLFVNTLYKNIRKNLLYPLVVAFLFFLMYFILIRNGESLLSVLAFVIAYVFPIPIFICHWNKIANLYINEEKATKKDYVILIITSLFLAQANEMMLVINTLILGFIVLEALVKYIKKEANNYFFSLPILFCIILFGSFVHQTKGSKDMQVIYIQFDNSLLSFEKFWVYLTQCFDKIFGDNLIFICSIIVSISIIAFSKEIKNKRKIISIVGYTLIATTLFFLALYFLNDSCHYADLIKDDIPSWWFLYFSLCAQFEMILIIVIMFLFQNILLSKNGKIFVSIIACFICFFAGSLMKQKSHLLEYDFYRQQELINLYKMDKIALHTLETQEYMYVPAEYMSTYYTISKDNETMPLDLVTKKYKNKKYFYIDTNKKLPYLEYLEEVYGVEADKKVIFDTEENIRAKLKHDNFSITIGEVTDIDFAKLEETYGEE